MRKLAKSLLLTAFLLPLGPSQADPAASFPGKPITVIVPFGAGGGADRGARHLTDHVARQEGWTFVVDNKPGGNGFIGISAILKQPADGHTILISGPSTHGGNSALIKNLPYDSLADFTVLTRTVVVPLALVVSPNLKAGSVAELIALAKQNPGTIRFASSNPTTQLAAEKFAQEAGIQLVHVPYKTSPQTMTDVLGGHVDMSFIDVITAGAHLQNGSVKGLAITSAERLPGFPQLPTLVELGYPDFEVANWLAVFIRSGTDPDVVEKLSRAFSQYTGSPEGQRYAADMSSYMTTMSQAEAQQWIEAEIDSYQKAFLAAGVQPQ